MQTETPIWARLQLGYQLPGGGFSQQMSYQISSTGALDQKQMFVEVGRGLGTHIWEDVDGDGFQDPEEFVPDVDGDYEIFYGVGGQFQPAREGALGARFELAAKRFLKRAEGAWGQFLKGISLDVSLEADRQVLPGSGSVAPWALQAFTSGPEVLSGRRDLRAKVYFFRYHRRASLQVSAGKRDRINRIVAGGGMEQVEEGSARGRYQLGRTFDWETTLLGERRQRVGQWAVFLPDRIAFCLKPGYLASFAGVADANGGRAGERSRAESGFECDLSGCETPR